MSIIKRSTPKDRFYAPLRKVASDYVPMLLGRMRVLETRAKRALEYLDSEEEQAEEKRRLEFYRTRKKKSRKLKKQNQLNKKYKQSEVLL